MCSFGSCQTRFEFLSQFRKVRNAFECFVAQAQTHLPKTKRVWPMKINVICTVLIHGRVFQHKPVTTGDSIIGLHNYRGFGRHASVDWYDSPDRTLPSVPIIVPSSRMTSSPLTIILQLISEQYMVELHSLPGRYTIFRYLADYVNTLSPIWYTLDNNTNPSGSSHIYTRKVLLPHIKHYHRDSIYFSLCN